MTAPNQRRVELARYKLTSCVRHAREWRRDARDPRIPSRERREYRRLSNESMGWECGARYWQHELRKATTTEKHS